jgi:uncharacterized RDD family membrane protein YckC
MTITQHTLQGQYAGFATRVIALVIDISIISAVLVGFNWFFTTSVEFLNIDMRNCEPQGFLPYIYFGACVVLGIVQIAVSALLWPLYFIFFWTLGGQTAGDALMGVRVVRLNGEPMTIVTSIKRLIGYGICIATFGIGFLWVIWDDRRQGWHDKLARTCVVYSWQARQNDLNLVKVRNRLARRSTKEPTA